VGAGVAVATLVPSFPDAYDIGPLPPILLDNGFGVTLLESLLASGDGTPRLPFAVERLRWWRAPSGRVRCGAVQSELGSDASDFTLVDEDGGVVAEVSGFSVRRAPREAFLARDAGASGGALYRLSWRESPLPANENPGAARSEGADPNENEGAAGTWIVVGAAGSASALALSARLPHGVLTEPSGLAAVLATEASVAGVVCVWEARAEEAPPATALRVATEALSVVHALLGRAPVRLWWVTSATVPVHEGERVTVGTSPVWGFGRALMQEHPELGCTLIDVGPGDEATDALSREVLARDDETQVAWRAGLRFVARLTRVEPGAMAREAPITKEGTVLVTGGLGALGLHVARWLARQGVRHLVLAGRRGLDTRGAAEAVAELEGLGSQVTVAAVDVADRNALEAVLGRIPAAVPLRGVVHAAVVLEDGVLAEQDAERFARVLSPKVAGAWNLHELTRGQALDFFVLFSSASGLLGAAGQANYAAANTFLDVLAAERRAADLVAQSIAWGAWSEVGLAAALDATLRSRLGRQGIGWLSPAEGIVLLERALSRPAANLGAMALDFEALRRAFGASVPPLWRVLIPAKVGRAAAAARGAWAAKLAALSAARRAEEVREAVRADVARVLGLGAAASAPLNRPFSELGLDSLMAIELRNAIGQRVGKTLSATLAFDHPTVDALTRWLLDEVLTSVEPAPIAPRAKLAATDEPIAIVGAGCRYPGGVTDLESFWRLLDDGVDAISEVPPSRWDADALYDPDPDAIGKITTRRGGFVGDIDRFDASFFNIPAREAATLDPQQRLLLETSWEALGRAGITTERLMGSETGVFVGLMSLDYHELAGHRFEAFDGYVSTGTGGSLASGRISYVMGLKGPSLTVDTACSSSLVTVHLACQALRQGECSLALAGGVTLMLTPGVFLDFSRLRGMSPDGRCKSFSAAADGAGWAEGCGMVVLKRLSDAQRDGDPILAVIRGSAVNQDGRSNGLTAPNGPSQEALIRRALAQAGMAAAQVSYVECHGTGTWLGDPIEGQALGAVMAEGRSPDQPLLIGSVKSNIGHTQAAAGVAGLLKVVLALQHERIPRTLHADEPTPHVRWTELSMKVASEAVGWPKTGEPRRAGVSSFGLSGTNAHVVLEEAPAAAPGRPMPARSAELVVLSARSEAALSAQVAQLSVHVSAHPEQGLGALAFSLATTRSPMEHRWAVATSSREGLVAALESAAKGQIPEGVSRGSPSRDGQKVVFVFPGQGSQWVGMGRKLLVEEPVFRRAMEACDRAILAEAGFSPLAELGAEESASQLGRIAVVQPLLFAVSVALAALWRSWGVLPDAVVGHSMGEVAAAHVAGALSLEDAVAIICRRSRLLQQIGGQGEMAVVELSHAEAEAALERYEERLGVAASNSPRSTVLSGEPVALAEVLARLEATGVFCRRVKVDVASHSPQVDPLRDQLVAALASLEPQAVKVPMRSTVIGAPIEGPELGAGYWADNLRQPVRFAEAVQALAESGHGLFVEMSPHPILVPAVEETLRAARRAGAAVGSMRRGQDERAALLEALGALWVRGCPVDWAGLFAEGGCRVPLPSYPFQRERYWLTEPADRGTSGSLGHNGGHPLLGSGVTVATQPRLWVAETALETARLPWLSDHRVQGEVVFPGAAYLEMALAAGAEQLGNEPLVLTNVVFAQALAFAEATAVTVQLLATEESPGRMKFQIASRTPSPGHVSWTQHARGTVQRADSDTAPARVDLSALRSRLGAPKSRQSIYSTLSARGLEYGPAFQGLSELRRGPGEALGTVRLPAVAGPASAYQIHPALLDACLQVMACTLDDGDDAAWVPVAVGAVRLLRRPSGEVSCHARRTWTDPEVADRTSADLLVVDADGAPVAEIRELEVQRLATDHRQDEQPKGFLELDWELAEVPAPTQTGGRFLLLGAGDGLGAALAAALSAAGHAVVHSATTDTSNSAVRARLASAFGEQAPTAVVHLGSLDWVGGLDHDSVERALSCGCDSVLATAQSLAGMGFRQAPRLWLLTRGAQAVSGRDVAPAQAPLLGLGRVIALEHAELRCARLDLDPARPSGELQALLAELVADDGEDEIALRGTERRVARLAPWQPAAEAREKTEPAAGRPFRLEIDEIGVLDHLVLRTQERRAPGPGEVEIAVEAAGLNFLDVLLAMGVMPHDVPGESDAPLQLGGECAGRIVAVGEGVAGLAVGTPVIALARGAFASHVTVPATLVAPRPEKLSAAEAAAMPVAYVTAYYALSRVARLERGERVLVHAATGGVGLAAVQWARHVGAEVYATAGSPEKRAYLESLGVRYVSDSRSDRFVDDVHAWTGGQGVDVVLNSLSGELIQKSFGLLRSHGRFVELGKTDYYADNQLGLRPFLRNLSFSLVDLRAMMLERPARVRALFDEVLGLIRDGVFTPPPITTSSISRAGEVFRTMAQAQHLGKLVLTLESPDVEIQVAASSEPTVRADGSYLLTGGLGGLGLTVADWLAKRGAGHLMLVGRSGAASVERRAAVAALEARGARVTVATADVADRAQVERILGAVDASGMPLRGVIHAAAVLDDELLVRQTPARLRAVMAPKVLGALHLDALTQTAPLDFFVMYSSAAGLLGSPGQSTYAAANTFLDALAHHRVARGLPALSIDWGAFSRVGLAAAQENRGVRLASRGIQSLTPEEGLSALARLLRGSRAQVGVVPLDVRQWVEFYPPAASSRMLARLLAEQRAGAARPKGDQDLLLRLASAAPADRVAILQELLRGLVSQVLRVPEAKLGLEAPLSSVGMDSLMGLELRNRIETTLGIRMPAALLWTYPTLVALSGHLATKIGELGPARSKRADRNEDDAPALAPTSNGAAADLDEMSEDELTLLIATKFEAAR
jgi:acyl transferase domain-containing protein/acyl carrier protein